MSAEAVIVPLQGLHSSEIASLRRSIDTKLRNAEIRSRYKELRRGGMEPIDAIDELEKEYHLSEGAINRAIWPR